MRPDTLLTLGLLGALAGAPAVTAQPLPTTWNRNLDWVPLQNPCPDSAGNLVWEAHHLRGGRPFGLSGNWDSAWHGWVSGGASYYSGVAPITSVALIHNPYYVHLWSRHHLITPVVVFKNTTGQAFDLAIGGTLGVSWSGLDGLAHDSPVIVEMSRYDLSVSQRTVLLSRLIAKPTPGTGRDTVRFPVRIPTFRFEPGDTVQWTVAARDRTAEGRLARSFVGLYDGDLWLQRSTVASETVRRASPPNPLTLNPGATSRPVLGRTWDPFITGSPAGAVSEFLTFGTTAVDLTTPIGTLLCDPLVFVTTQPGVSFAVPIPDSVALIGSSLCTQGGSVTAAPTVQLANALDLVLGDR